MFRRSIRRALWRLRARQRVAIGLARGAATSDSRALDPQVPASWEFCGFSQNGEDGLIDHLTRQVAEPTRYFVEIGAADGLENNTAWLAFARRWSGLMVEGNPELQDRANRIVSAFCLAVECRQAYVTRESAAELAQQALEKTPDVLSLDIDGMDYHVAGALLDAGLRPAIFVVEYNSAFGPERACTLPYRAQFDYVAAHSSQLYYGVSVSGWRRFFAGRGYEFVAVDCNGINAFFVDPARFPDGFCAGLTGPQYRENVVQRRAHRTDWEGQFAKVAQLELLEIDEP